MDIVASIWKFIRYSLASVLTLVVFGLLIVVLPASAITRSVTDKEKVQSWLTDPAVFSKVDETAKEVLVESLGSETAARRQAVDEIESPETQALFDEILTQDKYEEVVVALTEGVYAWLKGETEKPEFEVRIVDSPEKLQTLLITTFKSKVRQLPKCAPGEYDPNNFEPLGASCWPEGVSYNKVDEFIKANKSNPEFEAFLDSAVLSSDKLNLTENVGTTESVRTAYEAGKWLPLLLAVVLLLLSFLIIVLLYNWPLSLRWLGLTYAIAGGILLVGALTGLLFEGGLFGAIESRLPESFGANSQELINTVVSSIYTTVIMKLALFSALVAALGGGLITTGYYLFKPNPKA